MAQQEMRVERSRRLSLSLFVSLGLVFAAVIPLFITFLFSELQSRPTLISQATKAMQSDAQSRAALINTYISERLLDAQTLSQVPSVQTFIAANPNAPDYRDLATHGAYALGAGSFRDKHYMTWTLFNPSGKPMLSYPLAPQRHGQWIVPPNDLKQILALKTFASSVYYNPTTQKAAIDIYSPIVDTQHGTNALLGFMRATLNLDYIWSLVQEDKNNNGDGSYAFILDENGVRIADTFSSHLFTAIAPVSASVQQSVRDEARYGISSNVPVLPDAALAHDLQTTAPTDTFAIQPTGQHESFQVVRNTTSVVPWTYVVLSPTNTVTLIANRQLVFTLIVMVVVGGLVALLGLILGRTITYPILTSATALRKRSTSLSTLATKQRDAASEQMWVVDSSQVGLQAVQYYTDATKVAARQLSDIGTELARHWETLDRSSALHRLERIVAAAHYIENATQYQAASNQKLATALKVATQVTEQLVAGATSATEAATQLEQVVEQLRQVVGK
jgi:methyl-accepting chemotaxis protein